MSIRSFLMRLYRGLYGRSDLLRWWSEQRFFIHGKRIHGRWKQGRRQKMIPEMLLMNSLLESDACAFDVGANIGEFTFYLSGIITEGGVYAFEPQRRAYNILRGVCSGIKNASAYNFGLSSSSCTASLFVPIVNGRTSSPEASLDPHFNDFSGWERRPKSTGSLEEPVLLTTIDEFCQSESIQRLDFLKIDVEGHELEVLKGGERSCFERFRPLYLVEVFPYVYPGHFDKVCQYMNMHGYVGFVSSTGNCNRMERLTMQSIRESTGHNYWFVPEERIDDILGSVSLLNLQRQDCSIG